MKTLLITLLLLFSLSLQAQSGWLKEAKGVALCDCIRQMNMLADSTSVLGTKDYSIGYFIQKTDLPPQLVYDVVEYVRDKLTDFVETPQEMGGNMIAFSCWKFYHSKELDENIRKIIARYRPMKAKNIIKIKIIQTSTASNPFSGLVVLYLFMIIRNSSYCKFLI